MHGNECCHSLIFFKFHDMQWHNILQRDCKISIFCYINAYILSRNKRPTINIDSRLLFGGGMRDKVKGKMYNEKYNKMHGNPDLSY